MATYPKALKSIVVKTRQGEFTASDTVDNPIATRALGEFEQGKEMHILADPKDYIPFHAVETVTVTTTSGSIEREDPYCEEGGESTCEWKDFPVNETAGVVYDPQSKQTTFSAVTPPKAGDKLRFTRMVDGEPAEVYETTMRTECEMYGTATLVSTSACPTEVEPSGSFVMIDSAEPDSYGYLGTIYNYEYPVAKRGKIDMKIEICES